MSEAGLPPSPPPPRKGRRWVVITALALLALAAVAGLYVYVSLAAEGELRDAIAEADRLEPQGWRLHELEAQREALDNDENSAVKVLAARALLPRQWGQATAFRALFEELPPEARLNEQQITALRAELQQAAAALAEARKLADLPRGRHAVVGSPDYVNTSLAHAQHARDVAALLQYDALLRSHDGDADGAVRSVRAAFNAGRSLRDEPFVLAQLVRLNCRQVAVVALERTLAQAEPSADALAPLQQALEEDEAENLLLVLARDTRAGSDAVLEAGGDPASLRDFAFGFPYPVSPADRVALHLPDSTKGQRAALLRHLNQVVEAAKLPEEQQDAALDRLAEDARRGTLYLRLIAPSVANSRAACRGSSARLRCAVLAVAAERYRLEHGAWPESPDALVQAGLLKKVPRDPFDGRPLRWRRLDDGRVIYAVGPDGKEDGSTVNRGKADTDGAEVGFRLWDAARRRQPQ
jgi:hypothetical protein